MKILLTGATGFIGKYVVEILEKKYSKENLIILSSKNVPGIKSIPALDYHFNKEYLKEEGCEDAEVLIHMGAYIPKAQNEANQISLTTQNIFSTQKLLDACDDLLIKKVIFISSVDVYENSEEIYTEQTLVSPATMYGWSKIYCEQMIKNYAAERNIQYELLRLGHVFGAGEEKYKKAIPVMIKNALANQNLKIYGDGEARRTYMYVEDTAQAIVDSIELQGSEIINIVGDEAISVNRLAQMIIQQTGTDIEIEHYSNCSPNRNLFFDNRKMKSLLLNKFTPFTLGLQREIDYMRKIK